jgi:N-hydroxyarylamine O-acetyltransferase
MYDAIDIDAYCARVGYDGRLSVDAATLAALHEAHVGAVPFENLDIFLGRPIRLDLDHLAAKLIRDRRGGYCFEQSTLFKAVLDKLGFHTRILLARVRLGISRMVPRTHMLLEVDTPTGQYLADVGFGAQGLLRPLPMLPELVTHTPGAAFRLKHETGHWILEADLGEGWTDLYAFTLEPQYPVDIEMSNHYTATFPGSGFRKVLTAQRTRPDRRLTLKNDQLEIRRKGETERWTIDPSQLLLVLAREFDLHFPEGTRFAPPAE